MILHGHSFPTTILFLQSFRSAGWPIVQRGWGKLTTKLQQAKLVYDEEFPTILKARELLPKLSTEAKATLILFREAQKEADEVAKEYRLAERALTEAARAVDSIRKRADELSQRGSGGPDTGEIQAQRRELEAARDAAARAAGAVRDRLARAEALLAQARARRAEAERLAAEARGAASAVRRVADAVDPACVQVRCARGGS